MSTVLKDSGVRVRHQRRQRKPRPEMLPAPIPVELPPEGSSEQTVRQARLRELYHLERDYIAARDKYLAAYKKLQDLVLIGASIQNGDYHVASKVYSQRHPRYKQAVIDLKGEDFQRKVLESTAPIQHFRVRVH